MGDLQTLYHKVGFDKVRVHREMSPEEIKDFVKQRFKHQLKSSGLDDVSLYMDRFETLYEQGKMEHLMPTANQKQIVEDVPFMEWENPYIDTSDKEVAKGKKRSLLSGWQTVISVFRKPAADMITQFMIWITGNWTVACMTIRILP